MNVELQTEYLHYSHNMKIAKKAYMTLFRQCFPAEHKPWFIARPLLEAHFAKNDQRSRSIIIVQGTNLQDEAEAQVDAFVWATYYSDSACGLVDYVAKAPGKSHIDTAALQDLVVSEFRKEAEKDGKTLQGVFAEAISPHKAEALADCMNPALRIKIFKRAGGRKVAIDYVFPGSVFVPEVAYMDLYTCPPDRHSKSEGHASCETIAVFLQNIYEIAGKAESPILYRMLTELGVNVSVPDAASGWFSKVIHGAHNRRWTSGRRLNFTVARPQY